MALTAVPATRPPPIERPAFDPTFVTCFIAILAIALLAQTLLLKWRPWFPGAEGEKSVVGGVRAAVASIMSIV